MGYIVKLNKNHINLIWVESKVRKLEIKIIFKKFNGKRSLCVLSAFAALLN